MGEMKVEHVLLFLVGAFLVYHVMGKCILVEGAAAACKGSHGGKVVVIIAWMVIYLNYTKKEARKICGDNYWEWGLFSNHQCDGEPVKDHNPVTNKYYWRCTKGDTKCKDP